MSSHAKHAGARPVLSSDEIAKARGTRRMVVGSDSFANFDDCVLCLRTARDPVCCPKGHVFCKECIYTSLLHQKRVIAEKQAACRRLQEEKEAEAAQKEHEDRQHLLTTLRNMDAGIAAPQKQQQQKAGARVSATGSCFWVPTVTPTARATVADATGAKDDQQVRELRPMCPATKSTAEDAHTLRVKQLTPLVFTDADEEEAAAAARASKRRRTDSFGEEEAYEVAAGDDDDKAGPPPPTGRELLKHKHQCPVCLRLLTNTRQCALPKKCGHVACLECIQTLLVDSKDSKKKQKQKVGKCFVCGTEFCEKEVVKLQAGATGFAGHGDALVVESYRPSVPTSP